MHGLTLQQMADRIATLMESRLKVRGKGLAEKLKRGGKKLPRKVRSAAADLAKAADLARNPKVLPQLDHDALGQSYDLCHNHLIALQKWERRRDLAARWLLSVLASLVVLGVIIVALLQWRGYL